MAESNDRFGLCFVSAPDDLAGPARYQGALAAGAAWDRWPLYWTWVDEGGYVGAHAGGRHDYDTLVAQDLNHGLTPVVILLGTPARYARVEAEIQPAGNGRNRPDLPLLKESLHPANSAVLPPVGLLEPIFSDGTDVPGPGQKVNPANVWAEFVFNTVERYRPGGRLAREQGWASGVGVRHWEVWNEPDYTLFWRGSVADYYRLLEVAYKTIKTADPEATVLLGGLAFYDQPDWFPALLRQMAADPGPAYFDVLSVHHYLNIYGTERLVNQSREALAAYGLIGVPIWITESGVSVWDDYPATAYDVPADEPLRATMQEQAAYVLQNAALAFYNGVDRYYHFLLHDDCGDGLSSAYGLRQNLKHVCNPAQGAYRPAYAAYRLAADQFRELQPLWREGTYGQEQVAFYRAEDRSRIVVAWATQGMTATATITATGNDAQLYWIEASGPMTTSLASAYRAAALQPEMGLYTLTLPPATNQNGVLRTGSDYQIGGRPYLLVEQDTLPPWATVEPLPPASPAEFAVRWRGEEGGSGIAGYDLWVSENGGPLKSWLTGITATQAIYFGQVNHIYGFAVRARDQAGNVAPQPGAAQTTTRVTAGPTLTGLVLGPDSQPVAGAAVVIQSPNSITEQITGHDGVWATVSLPAGEYTLSAAAPGFGQWPTPRQLTLRGSTGITLTVAPAVNSVAYGDFEGNQVWTVWEWPQGQISLSHEAFDGQAGVRLGDGRGDAFTCPGSVEPGQIWTLQQPVSVPASRSFLSFLYKISATRTIAGEAWLAVDLVVDKQTFPLVSPGQISRATDWRLVSRDLAAWAGRDADLRFQVVRCSTRAFSVTLDRVSLGPLPAR